MSFTEHHETQIKLKLIETADNIDFEASEEADASAEPIKNTLLPNEKSSSLESGKTNATKSWS